jgi:hypothetical protein
MYLYGGKPNFITQLVAYSSNQPLIGLLMFSLLKDNATKTIPDILDEFMQREQVHVAKGGFQTQLLQWKETFKADTLQQPPGYNEPESQQFFRQLYAHGGHTHGGLVLQNRTAAQYFNKLCPHPDHSYNSPLSAESLEQEMWSTLAPSSQATFGCQ